LVSSNSDSWQRAGLGEPFDLRGAQRGDPLDGLVAVAQRVDAGGGDHAAVADHDHPVQLEADHHRLHGLGEGAGVGGVAGKDVDRDRPALGVGQQPVGDLPFLPSRE
jgi:hypothetical protein